MSGTRLTRAFARNAAESAYPNLWRGLVAAWAPPGAPRHATRLWDYSGNGNHGTLRNGTSWTTGKHGHALNFDGSDDDIIGDTPGKNFPTGNQSRSVSCWIKSSGWSGDKGLLHWGTDGGVLVASNFHLVAGSGGAILWGNGYGYGILYGNTYCNDNKWHHVAGTFDQTTGIATIYVDGRLDNFGSYSYTPATGEASYWSMGRFLNGYGAFPGTIANCTAFRRCLTSGELRQLMVCTMPLILSHDANIGILKDRRFTFYSVVC